MATTTNFGWETPDDTDLVKDGALAMRTLGNAIDASLVDLKGGTTGQVLSKTSNTDMDFTWVTSDDANAIQNAIVDAKGDLITATAADTPARLAVGNNGESLVADSSTSTGLRWQSNFAAGKNVALNGAFNIWQRGTSFSNPGSGSYTADRWLAVYDGAITTHTVSRQTFTPGTAPVAGYESEFFWRWVTTTNSTATYRQLQTKIEDVRTLSGTTATISFWAKADTNRSLGSAAWGQNFGSGGSGGVETTLTLSTTSLTTSWQRITATVSVPSISGKTVGSSSFVYLYFNLPVLGTVDIWGVQVEAGNTATAFQTTTGTLAGELAACMRYYQRIATGSDKAVTQSFAFSTTAVRGVFILPVPMRATPTIDQSTGTNYYLFIVNGGNLGITQFAIQTDSTNTVVNLGAATTGAVAGYGGYYYTNNASAYVGLSSEL